MSRNSSSNSAVAERIDVEMTSLFNRYLTRRSPLRLDDYAWDQICADSLDPEFIDALTFVTLVESNPTAPSDVILDAADRSDTSWLRRFIVQTWLPEESMHPEVYRKYLIASGLSNQSDIDQRIQETCDRGFIFGVGYTELQVATYGWLQELITWRFYESMRKYLLSKDRPDEPADMVLVKILGDVEKQENFHRYVYLAGINTVLRHAPERKWEVISAATEFLMPGHHMAPDMQKEAPNWSAKFGFSHSQLARDMVKDLCQMVGYDGLARAAIGYATKNEVYGHLKIAAALIGPIAGLKGSPVNTLVGKLLVRMYG